MPVKRV